MPITLKQFLKRNYLEQAYEYDHKFLEHLENDNAILKETKIGISKGCPLSPLLVALYLFELDECMSKLPVIYTRFQDDWCVLAKTRWHLRKVIKLTNQILNRLKVQKHPDKTFIGRVKKGYDFLGFRISAQGIIDLAVSTKEKMLIKLCKLYEQPRNDQQVIQYINNVHIWIRGIVYNVRKRHGTFDQFVTDNTKEVQEIWINRLRQDMQLLTERVKS